ncbi:F-ATPase, F0 complex, subunit A AtpB [Gottschalkia acidurici 9a]|uniref:ATP synthase subunit a n=1 Tax=Gottschalkia acidurici (strain ATCC 7906 / DSM 604 / BCRC 14475 / CIP 104303 / KCTC 5404 / NCIMB 10678 / 9a) TaxID=1128398 RepID=K0AVG8_GOTA9|nr:F0F1 ATP synthase subunit A [Gottschalkia acidurici]AFS77279.1 F-ATPase, F0 complex, subunit A AtpB [Gottschalkia acidurici 9a]
MGIELKIFGSTINDTVVNSWIIVIALSIFAIIINKKIKNTNPGEKPKGILNVLEILVTAVQGLVDQTMGKGKTRDALKPYIFTLAIFLACANLFGLLGFSSPTSDYNVTLGLTIITFGLVHYYGLKTNKLGGYLKGYFEPVAVMFPLNAVGVFADPISLSFRLFGNILAGGIILSLVYNGLKAITAFIVPFVSLPLHAYFDVWGGLLQTFIFIMISMVKISENLPSEADDK